MFTIAEQAEGVNIPLWAQRAIEALNSHGVRTRLIEHPPSDTRYDLAIELSARGEKRTYVLEIKDRVTTASLGTVSSRTVADVLLLAPHVTSAQAEHCRRLGIPYADGAGNIYLDWDSI